MPTVTHLVTVGDALTWCGRVVKGLHPSETATSDVEDVTHDKCLRAAEESYD